ncbi:MAG TPA: hypothetical protein ENK57_03870 [Polyangiaceae bacterium]|nr:hypothetical protein [Polyangiaceae bacterium]
MLTAGEALELELRGKRDEALQRELSQLTTEHVLMSPGWFGLETATPLQRAICRVSDGLPIGDLLELPLVDEPERYPEEVQGRLRWEYVFCEDLDQNKTAELTDLPATMPREMAVIAAIRAAKSLWAACKAIVASQTVDVSPCRPGEPARYSVLSVRKDNARAIYDHIITAMRNGPRLQEIIESYTESRTEFEVVVRHPSGARIEIRIVHGGASGQALISRYSAGGCFDEFPRMLGAEDSKVNFEESYKAIRGRLLDGAQLLFIGSPWVAMGPAYRMAEAHAGRPSPARVVARAVGPAMNPIWWTPERVREVRESGDATQTDKTGEEVYQTDVLGLFLRETKLSMFAMADLRKVARKSPLQLAPVPRCRYRFFIDPSGARNAFALAIAFRDFDGRRRMAFAKEWVPPFDEEEVMAEIARLCWPYRLAGDPTARKLYIGTDQWSFGALSALARRHDVVLVQHTANTREKNDWYRSLALDVSQAASEDPPADAVELCDVPHVRDDLVRVQRKLTQHGSSIYLPITSDGRHCDLAPAIVGAFYAEPLLPPLPPEEEAEPGWTREELEDAEKLDRELEEEDRGGVFTDRAWTSEREWR